MIKYFSVKLLFILSMVFLTSFFCIHLLDRRINKILLPYINVESERLVNNIVNKTINEEIKNINIKDLLVKNSIENTMSYNTKAINNLDIEIAKAIQNNLLEIDDGFIDEYFMPSRVKNGRFKKIKNGILCDVSIGSLRKSTLFANVGPTIPIKLLFGSQLKTNVDVEVNTYGINNAIVKVYFLVEIDEQITMPLSSERKKIKIKKPVAVDIIQGQIPNYYMGGLK